MMRIRLLSTSNGAVKVSKRGVTTLTRAVSGDEQIYSGNLEILPGIGKPDKFFGKLSKDLILHVIKQYICNDMSVFYVFSHLKTA